MHVGGKDLVDESTGRTGRNRQHPEAEVDDVDLSAGREIPPSTDGGRERELTRG